MVTATLTDAAGNTSAPSVAQTLTVSGANTFVTSMVLNSGLSLTNHRLITFGVAATSSAGPGITVTISINGGPPIYSGAIGGAPTSIMLPATETAYTVTVVFTDAAANTTTLTSTVTLDMSGPNLVVTLSPPTNGMYYDVGGSSTLTWTVTDANGVGSSSGSIEGQTISASGGHIDLDLLTAGSHTVSVTAYDAAGNARIVSLTFTIRPTLGGIMAAINDGAARGYMTAAEKTTLVNALNAVISAPGNSAKNKMKTFVSAIQSATSAQLTTAFQVLLLSWANDAASRL
jgi:hypothetical protein